ncbi:MAG: hypothetical protein JWN17_2794 [Frankiales bacterium]|nr:hypothetical protein [Frankiales bacterium]
MTGVRAPARRRLLVLVLLATAVMTVLGYALKAQCIDDYNADRDRLLCSNDVQVLYTNRGLGEKHFPYVDGRLDENGNLSGGVIEYPVLTGLFAWVAALPVSSEGGYLTSTAILLAPFSLLTAFLLVQMVRWRALVYALAPPLVWYSFHNWDLLVVCACVAAFSQWWRGRTVWASVLLAVGASLKTWPGFFVLPLALERWKAGDRRGAGLVVGAAVGTFALLNGPFALVNYDGWWAPYAFQGRRGADITSNSIWFWAGEKLTTDQLNHLIPVLLLAAFAGALAYGYTRPGRYPFVQVCGAMLCAFMLLNKAHSPQYALWLLPFFALLRLEWGWVTAYLAFDAVLYIGLFRWFYGLGHGEDFGIPKQMLVIGVWGRAVMLVLLFVVFLRSRSALDDDDAAPQEQPRELVAA